MTDLPFGISVVIPTYNRRQTLLRAIDSVASVTPERVEIVVVDDGSNEDPCLYLPGANRHGVTIRCFRFNRNRGAQSARNLGIRRSHFAYIAFLDSDDEFLPDKMDTVLPLLEPGKIDLLFHGTTGMARYGSLARLWQGRLPWLPFIWLASLYNPVVTPALVIRRSNRLGPPQLRYCEDYAFLLNYCEPRTRVRFLDVDLTKVHRPQGAVGGMSGARWAMRRGEFDARCVMLRTPGPADWLRFGIGSCAGIARIAADLVRGRYWRAGKEKIS